MKDLKNRLQLASISIHSSVFCIHLVDPMLLSDCQKHGVLIPDLLEDGHGHVRHLVPGAVLSAKCYFISSIILVPLPLPISVVLSKFWKER